MKRLSINGLRILSLLIAAAVITATVTGFYGMGNAAAKHAAASDTYTITDTVNF